MKIDEGLTDCDWLILVLVFIVILFFIWQSEPAILYPIEGGRYE